MGDGIVHGEGPTAMESKLGYLLSTCDVHITCFVTCKHHHFAIISIYRSPSTSGKNCIGELRSVLSLLSSSVNHIIIAGDFNTNLLNVNDTVTKQYVDLHCQIFN